MSSDANAVLVELIRLNVEPQGICAFLRAARDAKALELRKRAAAAAGARS